MTSKHMISELILYMSLAIFNFCLQIIFMYLTKAPIDGRLDIIKTHALTVLQCKYFGKLWLRKSFSCFLTRPVSLHPCRFRSIPLCIADSVPTPPSLAAPRLGKYVTRLGHSMAETVLFLTKKPICKYLLNLMELALSTLYKTWVGILFFFPSFVTVGELLHLFCLTFL